MYVSLTSDVKVRFSDCDFNTFIRSDEFTGLPVGTLNLHTPKFERSLIMIGMLKDGFRWILFELPLYSHSTPTFLTLTQHIRHEHWLWTSVEDSRGLGNTNLSCNQLQSAAITIQTKTTTFTKKGDSPHYPLHPLPTVPLPTLHPLPTPLTYTHYLHPLPTPITYTHHLHPQLYTP